jgi:hypothetical protein
MFVNDVCAKHSIKYKSFHGLFKGLKDHELIGGKNKNEKINIQ